MPTDNNGAAAPVHPLELALLGLIAAALALRCALNPGYAGVEIPRDLHQLLGRGRREP